VAAQPSTIQLEFAANKMTFSPDMGAAITHLTFGASPAVEVLKPQPEYQFEASVLFPFPNRLANGRYEFEGKEYEFPLNDFGRPNALHGLVFDQKFTLTDQGKDASKAWAVAQLELPGTHPAYPFPFRLAVNYSLSDKALEIEFEVTNTGNDNMPFGLGWHPYFNLASGLASCALKLPDCHEIEVDENLIPTGKKTPSRCFDDFRLMDGMQLDTCFEIDNVHVENSTLVILNDQQTLEVWQDANHPFIQVFTPDNGQTIAIEPMTCGINALNTHEGLHILKPESSLTLRCGVRLV
jgi:aldose 1-epimerase